MSTGIKVCLKGLRLEDYIHPREKKYRQSREEDAGLVGKGLDALNDLSVSIVRRITQGQYVEITRETAPRVMGILDDVCTILDHPTPPRVYVCRQMSQDIAVGGTDSAQILVPDCILDQFDEGMLYYVFGNAVSMFKAGHVRLATVCSVLGDSPLMMPFRLPLQAYLRAADLTSDRGGLLACQDIGAAMRYMLWEAGLPLRETRELDAPALTALAEAYLSEMERVGADWVTHLSSEWMKLNWATTAPIYRLRELCDWYRTDYEAILGRRGGR